MYKRLIAYHRLSVSPCESEVDNHMAEILTKRGKPVMKVEGFLYRLDRRGADDSKFWWCLIDGCSGRIKQIQRTFSLSTVTRIIVIQ